MFVFINSDDIKCFLGRALPTNMTVLIVREAINWTIFTETLLSICRFGTGIIRNAFLQFVFSSRRGKLYY